MEVQLGWLEPDPDADQAKTRTSKRPPFRPTIEVQMSWLEPDETSAEVAEPAEPEPAPPSSRKKPPRLPGAAHTLPPMPLIPSQRPPPPRRTMEVDMSWLEVVEGNKAAAEPSEAAETPKRPSARAPAKAERVAPRRTRGKPIPRED